MLENATKFNYAYSSSFADITGAGSIAMAMAITEGKISTSYQMAFDVNSRASGAGAIAIASPQNATINLRAETWSSISPYLDFSQKFINYNFTQNTDKILTGEHQSPQREVALRGFPPLSVGDAESHSAYPTTLLSKLPKKTPSFYLSSNRDGGVTMTDTRLVKLGSISNDGIFGVAGNTVDINYINPLTYADFTAVPLTF